jgi:plasmid stabilization system protein ParE
MVGRVIWATEAKADLRRLTKYLKKEHSQEYAERTARNYLWIIAQLAEHPTKGMVIDQARGLRRWKLDRHNYVTFSIDEEGIVVKNILAYKLNRSGF